MYERTEVEALLTAMWNEWIWTDETRPDSDMPRATPDHSKSNGLWAKKIDIERAWARADIADLDRLLLEEYYGNMTSAEALAIVLDWPTSEVELVMFHAIDQLLLELNGE